MTGYRIVRKFLTGRQSTVETWECELCGAVVAHVDHHAEWHAERDGIKYGMRS